jgi:hypothetical protein
VTDLDRHAIHRSQDLPVGHARPIRIMSEDYALYLWLPSTMLH